MRIRPLAAALLCATPLLHAEETTEPVIVTASRMTETADASLAPVTVITRADIERSQVSTVADLLQLQTGIDIDRNGGAASTTSVFLRGTNSNQVLVLVDGVRVNSATTGAFAWESLDPAQIERIEIVRGPRSTLYGSDAIGGVIQIFTRKLQGASARIEGGTYGTWGLQAGYGGGDDAVRYHLLAAGRGSDGFNVTNDKAANPYLTPDTDEDGYNQRSVTTGVEAPIGAATLGVNAWHAEGNVDFDNGFQETVNHSIDARLSGETTGNWSQSLRVGDAIDDVDTHAETYRSRIITRRHSADWQHTFQLTTGQMVVAGIDWTEVRGENRDPITGTVAFDKTLTNHGAYLNYSSRLGATDLQLGGRRDDHDTFDAHTTGQAALGYDATAQTRLVVSYGTAFKAPTFNELYYPWGGNPDLRPESSESRELSLRHRIDARQRVAVNLFQTDITDLIEWDKDFPWTARNVSKARIKGVEMEYAAALERWNLAANLTLEEPRDVEKDLPLFRRPDRKFAMSMTRALEAGSVRAEWLLVGARRDTGEERLPGYGLVNVAAVRPLSGQFRLEGRVDNLFDQQYTFATGYNTPGRVVMVSLAYGQ